MGRPAGRSREWRPGAALAHRPASRGRTMGAGGGRGWLGGFSLLYFFAFFLFPPPLSFLSLALLKSLKPPGIKATMSAPGAPRARRVNGAGARGAALPPSPRPSVTCGAAGPCERRSASPPPPPRRGPGRAVGSGGNLAPCVCASERGRARVCAPLKWRGRPGGEMPRRVGGRRGPRCRRGMGGGGSRASPICAPPSSPPPERCGGACGEPRGAPGPGGASWLPARCRRRGVPAVLGRSSPRSRGPPALGRPSERSGAERIGPGLPRGSLPAGRGRAGPPEGSQPFCLSVLIGRLPAPFPGPRAYH